MSKNNKNLKEGQWRSASGLILKHPLPLTILLNFVLLRARSSISFFGIRDCYIELWFGAIEKNLFWFRCTDSFFVVNCFDVILLFNIFKSLCGKCTKCLLVSWGWKAKLYIARAEETIAPPFRYFSIHPNMHDLCNFLSLKGAVGLINFGTSIVYSSDKYTRYHPISFLFLLSHVHRSKLKPLIHISGLFQLIHSSFKNHVRGIMSGF